jgi:radical SAM superfamily enzyme YgiQ (UPF0313 family)
MKLVFVDNLLLELRDGAFELYKQPHLGLISLAAVAESGGHNVAIYDPKRELENRRLTLDDSLYRQIAEHVLIMAPDVVGLTSLGCNFICTAKIAAYLKLQRPDLPILLGGPHATILDRAILHKFRQFDAIVRNEAEHTLLPVLAGIDRRQLFFIPGVTFRKGENVISNPGEPLVEDLDSLPWPAYHLYPIQDSHLTSIHVEVGRGCPFACTFCSTATFFGRKFRLKSAKRICDELDYLSRTYGLSDFSLSHDLFTVNRAKVVEFCEHVSSRKYSWACSARMDCVDSELLAIMRASGCRSVYYGVETGSARMQKVVNKRQDLGMVTPTLDMSERLGLFSTVSLITGYPQENQEDQDATLDLAGRCFYRDPDQIRVQLHLLTPEPGTRLLETFGSSMLYDGHITDFNFPTLEPDDAQIMRTNPDIFMNHHYFPTVLPRARNTFVTTTFTALYELGFPLVRHILSHYDGLLSRLMNDIYDFPGVADVEEPAERMLSFAGQSWGDEHYLTSLVKYITTANRLSKTTTSERQGLRQLRQQESPRKYRYCLSRGAALLRNIHDCKRILDLIEASPSGEVPDYLASRRADYCIVLSNDEGRQFRNYELEPGWADLLDDLTAYPSPDQPARADSLICDSAMEMMVIERFIEEGILSPLPACVPPRGQARYAAHN